MTSDKPRNEVHKILIQQNRKAFGEALVNCFQQSYRVPRVCFATDCAHAARELEAGPVDICLLDLDDPGSADLFFDLRAVFPTVPVLLTSTRLPGERAALSREDESRVLYLDTGCTAAALCETIGDIFGLPPLLEKDPRGEPILDGAAPSMQTRRLSGNLNILLPDLVQLKCLTGRSCILEIKEHRRTGQIFFHEGNIVHAHARRLEGLPALLVIFDWKSCHFTELPWAEPPTRSIHHRWEAILLELSRMADEADGRAADHLPGSGAILDPFQEV